ncbi:MAG: hypothetical protein MZW92_51050 [Comamonadaceae bacterium]|nr:hypothetical protein [Comamonadaceae bacterium]
MPLSSWTSRSPVAGAASVYRIGRRCRPREYPVDDGGKLPAQDAQFLVDAGAGDPGSEIP